MARCPDCLKFVSYGDEPDTDEITFSLDGTSLSMSGALYLTCGECGTQIAQAEMEASEDVEDHFDELRELKDGETVEYDLQEPEPTPTDRTQSETVIRRGKDKGKTRPITNPRYAKRYYGVEAACTVTRTILDADGNAVGEPEEAEIALSSECQASGFESMD